MTNNTERRIYQKPPLSVDDQISLLIERGLIVGDNKAEIVYYLTNVSYYHLSIYFKFFQRDDIFIKGTTFEEVLRIYTFDNKLRFLLLELLERIEKSFKSRVARNLSLATHDSHFHTSMEHYINETRYNELQLIFETVYGNSNEISIDHYRSKYTEPTLPPIWTTVEILTFGQVVKFSKALTRRNQNLIARSF
jgi:abortive infection bacteriophage resistance protein